MWSDSDPLPSTLLPGGWGTLLYKLYRHVPPNRVGFFAPFWTEYTLTYTLPILVWNRVWFSTELREYLNVFIVKNE